MFVVFHVSCITTRGIPGSSDPPTKFYIIYYIFKGACHVLGPLNLPGYQCPSDTPDHDRHVLNNRR